LNNFRSIFVLKFEKRANITPLKRLIRIFITFVKGNFTISGRVFFLIFLARKKLCYGHFSMKTIFFHTTVNPGSGTGIPVLKSSSTVIPVLKKSTGIANPIRAPCFCVNYRLRAVKTFSDSKSLLLGLGPPYYKSLGIFLITFCNFDPFLAKKESKY
jgi:hypothetical protein